MLGAIVLAVVVGIASGGVSSILDIVLVSAEGIIFVLAVIFWGSILFPKARKRFAKERKPISPLR